MGAATRVRLEPDCAERISVLGVVTPRHAAELENILLHTRWRVHLVHSIAEATEAIGCQPGCVILCEQNLDDGTWTDLVAATEQLCPPPRLIVLSPHADMEMWEEVLNSGGYDLLAWPVSANDIYDVVPLAWRLANDIGQRQTQAEPAL